MTEMNYEAIGRCKILNEKIKNLHTERMAAIGELRTVIYALHHKGNIHRTPPEIVAFNADDLATLVEKISAVDGELMRTVNEYNNWCHEAGEKPVKLIEIE